jgi:hypothetical protein
MDKRGASRISGRFLWDCLYLVLGDSSFLRVRFNARIFLDTLR